MTDTNKLKLSRRNTKGKLTRTLLMIHSLLDNDTDDLETLKGYVTRAEEQFHRVEERHAELIDSIEAESQFDEEEKWMTECEKEFVQVLIQARRLINRLSLHSSSNTDSTSTPSTHTASPGPSEPVSPGTSVPMSSQAPPTPSRALSQSTSAPSPKMAPMKFPTFSGDLKDYNRFKQLFLHCAGGLTEIECFYQLTEAMVNSRERSMIKGCISVERAWEVLDEYYGDQDKVVDSLLKELDDLKPYEYKGKVNLPAMRRFVQTLQTFETQAETVGLAGELNSRIMLSNIRHKLPEEHRIAFFKSVRDERTPDTLTGLVRWLYSQLLLLDKAKPAHTEAPTPYKNDKTSRSSNSVTYNPSPRQHGKGSRPEVPKCVLHQESNTHYLKTCNKFRGLDLKEKHDLMRKHSICNRCGHNNCGAGKPPYDLSSCQFVSPCSIRTCGSDAHFSAVCPVVYGSNVSSPSQPRDPPGQFNANARSSRQGPNPVNVTTATGTQLGGILPTVMGYLRIGNTRHLVRILLDGGSQATLVREGILPRMEHDRYQDHELTLVGGHTMSRRLRLIDCHIEDLEGKRTYPLTMIEIDKPCGNAPIIQADDLCQYDHLSDIEVSTAPSITIDVLLGVDNTHLMIWEEFIRGQRSDDPVAVRCPLGWFIQGGHSSSTSRLSNYVNVSAIGPIEEFIGLETMGLEPKRCRCSSDLLDRNATEIMQQSMSQLPDGAYEVALPWRKSPENIPDNYEYAVKRQKHLEKQFANKPEKWEVYCKQMRDQLKRGVSRQVTEEELRQDRAAGKKMWFLPHFAVTKDSSTTPVRVVYDGKARFQGHALNDYLMKGENANSDLFEVALRFREQEVGVIADISKMYQAIKIKPDDARFHRFIFRENPSHPMQVFELTTVTFGDKPSPTAAIITLRHVVHEHAPHDEGLKEVVSKQFYMDDLNESVPDLKQALELKSKLTEILGKGKFNLRKWQSNEQEVCDESEDTKSATILGTRWNLEKDTLSVKEVRPDKGIPTKRSILKQTASYYDVFGILSGILVRPKIFLQKLWQLNLDWDTPINPQGELCAVLDAINKDLEEATDVEIPRCLIPEKFKGVRPLPEVSLHGASDASEDAMGMGVWLRWSHPESTEAELSFVCARARLTPLKQSSMPRKELQAILLLSRLMCTIKDALRFNIAYCKIWTDSMTAISWLRGQSKSFRAFVAYRVGEITTRFDPIMDIAYVPSAQNASDLVSRGGTAAEMKRVIDGPDYLKLHPSLWPKTPENVPTDPKDTERKKFHTRNAKSFALSVSAVCKASPIIEASKFSSWPKLKMVTARVLSVRDLPKDKRLKQLTNQISQWPSRKLVREAELYWIRHAQRGINFQDPNIMKLDPFFDDETQVFRVGGRMDRAPVSYDVRHPYLLPKKSHISWLIVQDSHAHSLHGGHLRTATEVRKKYWIVGDTGISRRVVRACVICRRHRGKPVQQKMSDLPDFRVGRCSPPFQTTLVDYLGPVNVKLSRNTTTKGYGAVFTCAVTRAVHLTCVPDLSTDAFLQALERFVSIRGAPSMLISDNATCFRGADNTINKLNLKLDHDRVRERCLRYCAEWRFGPPGGPHHQGAVERIVQEVKKGMRHLVKADRLTFAEWETVFSQISGLINSRPITAKSSSPLDHPPLTPNHFLIGRGDLSCPQIPYDDFKGDLRKRREVCNAMVDGFWKRWMECIRTLSPRQKWHQSTENLEESDVVLIIGDNKARGSWKMAVVVKAYPGKDDLVRIVDVKNADGVIARKPVTKLILLMKKSERDDLE
eukprot:XP_003730892.1 PREDICTED: uncharacterized protein LOC100888831 [Strongylocentrotus purpuratus]